MLKNKDIPHEKMKVLLASSNKFVAGEILLPTSTQYFTCISTLPIANTQCIHVCYILTMV